MKNLMRRALVLAFTCGLVAACADDGQPAATTTSPTEPAPPVDGAVRSDGQIVLVVRSADQAEVDEGTLAQARSRSDAVRAFAARMVTEHGAAIQRLDALASARGITAEESVVHQTLLTEAKASLDALRGAPAATFDLAYVGSQIVGHRRVLAILDETLIPSTHDAQLRQELVTMRADVAAHLDAAQALDATLPPTDTGQIAP